MRQYKFRIWDKDLRRMISWDSIVEQKLSLTDVFLAQQFPQLYAAGIYRNSVPMLYTGLNDIKDTEIYEGDIIRISAHYEGDYWEKETTEIVELENGGYSITSEDIYNYNIEVIGHIFDKK